MRNFSKIFTILFFVLLLFAVFISRERKYNPFQTESLKDVVTKSLEGAKGDYSVVIQNLKTGESYTLNKDKIYESASLYKLWVMAAVFQEIKNGNLKEDQVLSATIPELNEEFDLDPEEAERTEGAIELTVNQAVSQMITISHNYAAILLSSEVGNQKISNLMEDYGFTNSTYARGESGPQTSASDIAAFYEKLYKGDIVDKEYSQKMVDILLQQELNDRIPKYLPKDTKVAHKTGELGFFKHDAGIVFLPETDYMVVVLSESNSPQGAAERIANLSKAVYDYFQK